MKPRILFVDDDRSLLNGLRRMLHPCGREWAMEFVESGAAALEALRQGPFDVVVTDMRMPGMDGARLLVEVKRRFPHIVRIVLSGEADRETTLASLGSSHLWLSKPCDTERLVKALARACGLRERLIDEKVKQLVGQIESLPSLPALYTKLLDACRSRTASVRMIAEIISQDVAMSAKILQVVNSAFFGLRRDISSPLQAVQILGLDTVRALALVVHVFSRFERSPHAPAVARLWRHALTTSRFARAIAAAEHGGPDIVDAACAAGLLHDTGHVVLAAHMPSQWGEALTLAGAAPLPVPEAETRIFGATHAAIGAYLLGLWGLPDAIVEAVAYHHSPSGCLDRRFSPLTAVHVADALAHEGEGPDGEGEPDRDYLAELGLEARLSAWRDLHETLPGEACVR